MTDTPTQESAGGRSSADQSPVAESSAAGNSAVSLRAVAKSFGAVRAVDGLDLEIRSGEFFSMLGPSGSGKTTVLRMIAGFEEPSEGRVLLGGLDVTELAPFDRDVNTVFQDYALFPHLSVRQNVEYGLKVKRMPRADRTARLEQALATVRLEALADRRPAELSGGQRQRVALARALVNRPLVLLLDEPLGALDLKLRLQMQLELKQIQREAGITFVFVTHDQDEALTMSDRIAVFNAGRIEQVGTPAEVYEHPATPFVAGFVGTANLLDGEAAAALLGAPGRYAIRPEKIRVLPPGSPGGDDARDEVGDDEVTASGRVADLVYAGAQTRILVDLDAGGRLTVLRQNGGEEHVTPDRGSAVVLRWRRSHTIALNSTA